MKNLSHAVCRYGRWMLPMLALLLVLWGAAPVQAGLTVNLNLYRYDSGYVAYAYLNDNGIEPDFPEGDYLIASPSYPSGGSHLLYTASGGEISQGINNNYGGGNIIPSYDDFMAEVTGGLWSIWVTNGGVTQYQFAVNITGLTSNLFGPVVVVTYPQNNANNIPPQPMFTWSGPSTWEDVDVLVQFIDNNYSYVTSDFLPPNTTSWTPSVVLPAGMNSFSVGYRTNIAALVSSTTPTNSTGQPISGWASSGSLNMRAYSDFNVVGDASSQALVARYNFEDTGWPGRDTSGNDNHNNCSSSGGPTEDVATPDAAVGTYARQYFGETGLCFTDGGSAFPNLSNALAGSFTVTAWVKTVATVGSDEDDANWGNPIFYADGNGADYTIPLSITGSKAAFTIYDENDSPTTVHSTTSVNNGTYHLLAVTREQSTGLMRLYVNGQLEASATATTADLTPATYVALASGNWFYEGLLDDVRLYATNLSATAIAALAGNPPSNPLSDALDSSGLIWTTGGDADWFAQTSTTHDTVDAAQSGAIGDDEFSWIETTITGPGMLSFWWRVDSEDQNGYDYLEFSIGGNNWNEISGDYGWEYYEVHLESGPQTVRWTYWKDSSDSAGADAAWLDEVNFVPDVGPTITFQPIDQTNYPGYVATLIADATAQPEAEWQWYKVGSGAISGANSRFLYLTNSGTAGVAGSYYALAFNSVSGVFTRTAVVSFVSAPLPPEWSKAFHPQLTGDFEVRRTNYGIATLLDASGNIYSANSFTGTNEFTTNTFAAGPGRFASGLFKFTTNGAALWGRAITNDGGGNSYPQCLAKAPGDGVYMSGVFLGTNYLGTNVLAASLEASRVYLVRFDSAGNVVWVRTFGGTNSQFQIYHQLVADPDGNVTISALGDNFVDFGSTNVTLAGQKGILAQYDANGAIRWISQPSGWVQYMTYSAGRIYSTFNGGETNFIGGLTNLSDRKYCLAALNATNGQALWLQGIGPEQDTGNPSATDDIPTVSVSGADVFVTGVAWGSGASFGPYSVSWPGTNGQYFARFNTNGTAELATTFGGTNTWVWAAVADAAGNVYVSGDFDGYSTFGTKIIGGPRLGGIADPFRGQMYVAKFDRNGNALWVKQAQAEVPTSFVNVRDLILAPDGVWACGYVNYYANFGTNLANRVYGPVTIIGFPFGFIHYWTGGYLAKITEAAPLTPNPITLLNPQTSGANFQFQFQSQSGFTHAVQYRTNLVTGQAWQTYSNVTGDGGVKIIGVPQSLFSPAQHGFIRVSTQ